MGAGWIRRLAAAGFVTLIAVAPAAPAGAAVATGPVPGLSVLNTLACPAGTSCVSTGTDASGNGKGAVITAATGGVKVWPGKLASVPAAVACPPASSTCLFVAVNAVGTVTRSTGALKVTAKPPPPPGGLVALTAVACPKSCYAVGFEGTRASPRAVLLHLSAAGKILATTKDTGTGSSAIACPAAGLCLMSDFAKPVESIQVVTSGHIGASHAFPAGTFVQYLSCHGSDVCLALGGSTSASPALADELFPVNPHTGAIGAPVGIGGNFSGVSIDCTSATTCLVAGFIETGSGTAALVIVTHGAPGSPVKYPGNNLDAAACATAGTCYAVGLSPSGAIVDKVKG